MPPARRAVLLLPLALAGACQALPVGIHEVVTRCFDPAPLEGRADPRAPGYVVLFRDGTDAEAETWRLARRHGFRPDHVYTRAGPGFAARLSVTALAGVRCEASVKSLWHNEVGTAG